MPYVVHISYDIWHLISGAYENVLSSFILAPILKVILFHYI